MGILCETSVPTRAMQQAAQQGFQKAKLTSQAAWRHGNNLNSWCQGNTCA